MDPEDKDFDEKMKARFKELPPVVQIAIKSAEVEKHLRELANAHKLHLDQWQLLENEVMLTLFGFEEPENLQTNIKNELGITDDIAKTLADDISYIIFAPIREELERQLEHPNAKPTEVTDMESARTQEIGSEAIRSSALDAPTRPGPVTASKPAATPVAPATPPGAPPTGKVVRAPVSETYTPSVPSKERAAIQGDPYREQIK